MVPASSHPREFQKKRDVIISKTLISGMSSEDETATLVAKVLNLKGVLDRGEQSEAVLLAALTKLQRMVLSVKVLKVTGVGISVNRLRSHASKKVVQVSREVVKVWKGIVGTWLKENNKKNTQIKGAGESVQNPPPPRSLVIRIKLKKDDSKEVSKPVLGVSDETVKKVESICSSVETQTGIRRLVGVPDNKNGSKITGLKTGRKIEGVDSGNMKKHILLDYECDIFNESVKAKGIGSSVGAIDEKNGSKESGLRVDSKKRKIEDGVEEEVNPMWMKKYYVEEKKIKIKRLTYDEEIRLWSSTQTKPPHKRQMRRRW